MMVTVSVKRVLRHMFVGLAVVGAMGVAGHANAAPNLVTNGSFTNVAAGVSSPGAYICTGNSASCASGATSNLTSWTSTCNNNTCGNGNSVGSILYAGTNGSAFNGGVGLNGTISASPDGGNMVAIDADSTYTVALQQVITGLTVGGSYNLTFYQAADQQSGSPIVTTTDRWQVTLGGSAAQSGATMVDTNGQFTGWTQQSLYFVADNTSAVLKFMAIGTPAGVPPVALLDGVSLSSVPEPAAWLALVVGLGAVGFVKFRRPTGSAAA